MPKAPASLDMRGQRISKSKLPVEGVYDVWLAEAAMGEGQLGHSQVFRLPCYSF